MSNEQQVEKDDVSRILGTGNIIVFVKKSSDGNRTQKLVVLEWLSSPIITQSMQSNQFGIAEFSIDSHSGIYRVTVEYDTQYGYIVGNSNDEGYHTFLVS
jgi:hypothetical protein